VRSAALICPWLGHQHTGSFVENDSRARSPLGDALLCRFPLRADQARKTSWNIFTVFSQDLLSASAL
jgi:hypothetical protein